MDTKLRYASVIASACGICLATVIGPYSANASETASAATHALHAPVDGTGARNTAETSRPADVARDQVHDPGDLTRSLRGKPIDSKSGKHLGITAHAYGAKPFDGHIQGGTPGDVAWPDDNA